MPSKCTLAITLLAPLLLGCAAGRKGTITAAPANADLINGETTQADVVERLGPPDLIIPKGGVCIWTYDDAARRGDDGSADYLAFLFGGASGDHVRSGRGSSMLTLYFDELGVLRDYRTSEIED